MIIKTILKKIYHFIFRYKFLKKELNTLKEENDQIKFQFEYLKRHSDITKLKPATGMLRDYQINELNFAKEVVALFNSMNIYPFFDGGCLIGTVRHKGFVPWDDDIDLGLMRSDYDKIESIAKDRFIWQDYDNKKKDSDLTKFVDEGLKDNPDKYFFFRTPYCIHCYKGTSILDSVNVEFFPYDFVKDGVTDEEYKDYIEYIKPQVQLQRPWNEIFDFYKKELNNSKCLSKEKASRIIPGLGNYALTQYKFNGFLNYDDIYPLVEMKFEDQMIPVPNKVVTRVENLYKNWNNYPKDLGISHDMESKKQYYRESGINYKEEDFIF